MRLYIVRPPDDAHAKLPMLTDTIGSSSPAQVARHVKSIKNAAWGKRLRTVEGHRASTDLSEPCRRHGARLLNNSLACWCSAPVSA